MRIAASTCFNPRSPRGGATPSYYLPDFSQKSFQSTLPTRGSDANGAYDAIAREKFQSTLPTRGSDDPCYQPYHSAYVSIHAPHEGERPSPEVAPMRAVYVSIHAPHEGERRGAWSLSRPVHRFNPRSPRGGATRHMRLLTVTNGVSIHAPHEGERPEKSSKSSRIMQSFNPRSPRGGATMQN